MRRALRSGGPPPLALPPLVLPPPALPLALLLALLLALAAGCTADRAEEVERTADLGPSDGTGARSSQDLAPPRPDSAGGGGGATDLGAALADGGLLPPCHCPGGRCVRRELDARDLCTQPCRAGTCPPGQTCLSFPPHDLCLPAGSRSQGTYCQTGNDCAGGLCFYTGGRTRFCSRQCAGPADASCGAGWSCLPSLNPQGAWHCYRTGEVATGGRCSEQEPWVCRGGFCLGQGISAYCSQQCGDGYPPCPVDWPCEPHGEGSLCKTAF
ncbi:MAG: hypothetical protein FJ125_06780 [Deltaproteobacteria bacterium]|nr:hypothetical protein [Deltaproteobacteria bacterium]